MNIEEVQKWRPFAHPDGNVRYLSSLDAHLITYSHAEAGKPDKVYAFLVTYTFLVDN